MVVVVVVVVVVLDDVVVVGDVGGTLAVRGACACACAADSEGEAPLHAVARSATLKREVAAAAHFTGRQRTGPA